MSASADSRHSPQVAAASLGSPSDWGLNTQDPVANDEMTLADSWLVRVFLYSLSSY